MLFFIDSFNAGAAEDMAHSSLRFGIGRFTTEAEIDFVVERIAATVNRLRDMRYIGIFIITLNNTNHCNIVRYGKWFKKESILTVSTGHSTKLFCFDIILSRLLIYIHS